MSTRIYQYKALVGIELENNLVQYIYIYYHVHPTKLGVSLLTNHNDSKSVKEFINRGSLTTRMVRHIHKKDIRDDIFKDFRNMNLNNNWHYSKDYTSRDPDYPKTEEIDFSNVTDDNRWFYIFSKSKIKENKYEWTLFDGLRRKFFDNTDFREYAYSIKQNYALRQKIMLDGLKDRLLEDIEKELSQFFGDLHPIILQEFINIIASKILRSYHYIHLNGKVLEREKIQLENNKTQNTWEFQEELIETKKVFDIITDNILFNKVYNYDFYGLNE